MCIRDRSLLTGESDAIHKRPGDELMSGSFIDAGLVYARVIHVGADNYEMCIRDSPSGA